MTLYLKKVYYGWWILAGAILAQFVSVSTGQMVSGIFLGPIVEELGIEVWQFATAVSFASAIGGMTVLVWGPLVDRIGPRRIMLVGAIFASLGLVGLAAHSTFVQFFALQIVSSALGWALFGPLVINATIAKWFIVRRGWALAIGSTGVSLAGMITPIAMTAAVDSFGWRTGYLILAAGVLCIIVPIAFVMRRQPEDFGLLPDRGQPDQNDSKETAALLRDDRQTYTRSQAIRTSGFWLLSLAYGLNAAALGSVALHAIPFATSVGFERSLAAVALGINGVGNLISKAVWGWGLQRFDARKLAATAFFASALGVIIMVVAGSMASTMLLLLGFFFYGFGFGGTIPISEFLWARYFGRKHIAAVRGAGRPITIIFALLGPIATGAWFDISGSYLLAFLVLACLYLIGAFVINLSKAPIPIAGGND